ncbi:putative uncharacterized protein DDB_G0271606 [Drosophila grimshawi]|uniref:putative uncharacterized protein DDB_G0271606 n=1 Tax=Drosophila grimshawi TaxID=7222 RepID=UPI001C934112|nr:putative uncharacterized protein DDB_G0271606 [Drosophila grimshawi]
MIKLATTETAVAKPNVNASVFMPRSKSIKINNKNNDEEACNIEALDKRKAKQTKLFLPWKGFPKPIKYEQRSGKGHQLSKEREALWIKEPTPNEVKALNDQNNQNAVVKVGILEEKRREQERKVALEALKLVEQRRMREALQQPKDTLHLIREPIHFTAEERLRVNRLRIIKREKIERVLREMRQELEAKKEQQQQKQHQQQQQSKQQKQQKQQQQQSKLEEQRHQSEQQQQHKQQQPQQQQQSKLEEQQFKLEQIRMNPNSRYVCLQRASKPETQIEHQTQSEQQQTQSEQQQQQLDKPEKEQQSELQSDQPEQQLASQQPQQLLDSKSNPKPAPPKRYIPTAKQWDERCRAKANEAATNVANKENTVSGKSAGKLEELSQMPRAMSVSSQSNIMPMETRKLAKCDGGTAAKELFVPRYWPPAPLAVGQGECRRGNLIHARNISRAFANCGLLPTPNSNSNSNCNSSSSSDCSSNFSSICEEPLPSSKSIKRYGIDELLNWEPEASKLEQPHIGEAHRKLAFIYK